MEQRSQRSVGTSAVVLFGGVQKIERIIGKHLGFRYLL